MKIYLAIPYSGMEEASFAFANKTAGVLMKEGHVVFSPISHSHPIQAAVDFPTPWEFWRRQDFPMIEWCDVVYVCRFGEWEKSKGVCAEIDRARELGKAVVFMEGK